MGRIEIQSRKKTGSIFLRNACIHLRDPQCHSAEDSLQNASAICCVRSTWGDRQTDEGLDGDRGLVTTSVSPGSTANCFTRPSGEQLASD